MPDYNPAVALDIKPPENNLAKTFDTIANIQQAQAHTGLYTLQAAQQQRRLNALQGAAEDYRAGKDPLPRYLGMGGDPAEANTLQNVFAGQRAMQATPGGLMPAAYEQLQGAREKSAQTSNLGVQHDILQTEQAKKDMELRGDIAQSLYNNPSDDNWKVGVASLKRGEHISPEGQARIDAATKNPALRQQVAIDMMAATDRASKLHNYSATEGVTTPLGEMQRNAPQPGARPTGGNAQGAILPPPVGQENSMYLARPDMGGQPPTQTMGRAPMSPAQAEEQKHRGEYLGQLPGKLTEDANNAKQQSNILDQMKLESQTWNMGKGAETLMKAQQYMKPIANAFGSDYFDKPVADYESFVKNSGTLVRSAVKEVSSRAAVQEFNLIQKQLPSADMSRQGFYQIADQFHSVNDFKLAKEQAGNAWGRPVTQGGHGTMEGFEADWNKNITPTAFFVHRMSPEQLHKTLDGLQAAGPEGKAAIASIKQQLQYANKAGLF